MNENEQGQWNAFCADAVAAAAKAGGSAGTMFNRELHRQIAPRLAALDEAQREAATSIAKLHGFKTTGELFVEESLNHQLGCCDHGYEPEHCPLGCACGEISGGANT